MRYIRYRILLFFFIGINIPTIIAQTGAVDDRSIEVYLSKFNKDCTNGMQTANPEIIVNHYDTDMYLMPAFQKTLLGKENALRYYKAFFDRFIIIAYERENIETLDLGAQLSVIGEFKMKVKLKNGTKVEELKGKYLDIWKKEKEKLSLISEIWNYNHHTDLNEQLKFNDIPGTVLAYQGHLPIDTDIRFEIASINHFSAEFIAQKDAVLWSQLYADNPIALFSYKPIFKDKNTLDTYIKNHVTELPIFEKLDIRNNYINDLGNYVVNYASHIANWRNGEHSGISTGKGIKIWKRTANGTLKIFRQISTYD